MTFSGRHWADVNISRRTSEERGVAGTWPRWKAEGRRVIDSTADGDGTNEMTGGINAIHIRVELIN